MQPHSIDAWTHTHDYRTDAELQAERRTRWVVYLTLATMVVELIAGWLTGSMALLADGWHMGSHAAALGMSVIAYRFSRRWAGDDRFTFGTGKVPTLAGYTSSLLLGLGALWLFWESLTRFLQPITIQYSEAITVAILGLVVNVASAWILGGGSAHHHHGHDHDHHGQEHADAHQGHREYKDHNLRAAYLHVIADALTSVLAIGALSAGMLLGWAFLDPLMGIVGALLIGRWAYGLAKDSAQTLLDAEDHRTIASQIRAALETIDDVQIADLHLWRVGAASRACILSIVTHDPQSVEHYKRLLADIPGIDHLTLEVNQCQDAHCRNRD
ncbi:CDF family Co(II)/Ni(II) efflux transporter DmeF [Halochromatium roseum]|uniref:CDF family Co(II)/Ni(II) efflux transporter DmeF n=1 Tax=Halochromatium roseum TaxID=391920 RepID=UPI001914A4EA|nr:CDF family Co(II)/Ni(II) efflux transporter DmeF [Halochromatium roseum]MBK5939914.1 cation transporter [Halochromatium roseum]